MTIPGLTNNMVARALADNDREEAVKMKTYTIKPLEWAKKMEVWLARTLSGFYFIGNCEGGECFLHFPDDAPHKYFLTIALAKQAAQDHWEVQLKSALEEQA